MCFSFFVNNLVGIVKSVDVYLRGFRIITFFRKSLKKSITYLTNYIQYHQYINKTLININLNQTVIQLILNKIAICLIIIVHLLINLILFNKCLILLFIEIKLLYLYNSNYIYL